jgi:hypothetical protein
MGNDLGRKAQGQQPEHRNCSHHQRLSIYELSSDSQDKFQALYTSSFMFLASSVASHSHLPHNQEAELFTVK